MKARKRNFTNARRTILIMKKAFTLIELLIVVAIIAILAAIAVPNFLEAQTRSKVSRAKADMRTLATGLEAYRVDENAYPLSNNFGTASAEPALGNIPVLERLSTPIAYLTTGLLPDPFLTKFRSGSISSSDGGWTPTAAVNDEVQYFKYATPGENGLQDVNGAGDRALYYYILQSNGPDLTYLNLSGLLQSSSAEVNTIRNIYDPTNGTVSRGSVFRIGGVTTGDGNYGGAFFSAVSKTQD